MTTMRQLQLSNMYYFDDEINAEKANQLIVYHYSLNNQYTWWESKGYLDAELDSRQFAYLVRGSDLYIAVQDSDSTPPEIRNKNREIIQPERVYYDARLNPVWIRLMMRLLRAFGSHCKGAYSLGLPLLNLHSWSTGIDAMSIDCRTQQLKDKRTTEVILKCTNIPLRIVDEMDLSKNKDPLWMYDKNKILVRWYPDKDKKPKGALYREILKGKNRRKQRAFIDLTSPRSFLGSRPMILAPIIEEFIEFSRRYGFDLHCKTLNLEKLKTNTKYSTVKNQTKFSSIDFSGEVKVLDLRFNRSITSNDVLKKLQEMMDHRNFNVQCRLLEDDLLVSSLQKNERLLVLLDQVKGVENDQYVYTKHLVTECAVQHININPHDIIMDPVEEKYLLEVETEKSETLFIADKNYYDYKLEMFDLKEYQEEINIKLDVVLKELALKKILINPDQLISEVLPNQQACFNSDVIVISEGYLFTIKNDRPILIPLNLENEEIMLQLNTYLSDFSINIFSLLALIYEQWPYHYRDEKQYKSLEKRTLILSKMTNGEISIMMADPSYEPIHIFPSGMKDVHANLIKKQANHPLVDWWISENDLERLYDLVKNLGDDGSLNPKVLQRLMQELPKLLELWRLEVSTLYNENVVSISYLQIKKKVFAIWLQNNNKKKDTYLSGAWDTLLSEYFDRLLTDIKRWLKNIPGIQHLWFDKEQGYYIVGSLAAPKDKLMRQPSIQRWHALSGEMNIQLLADLLDVDWVRMNQLAGNPCALTLIKRWKEINRHTSELAMLIQ